MKGDRTTVMSFPHGQRGVSILGTQNQLVPKFKLYRDFIFGDNLVELVKSQIYIRTTYILHVCGPVTFGKG